MDVLQIEPDAREELAAWHFKTKTLVIMGKSVAKGASGPYVLAGEKT